MLTNYFHSTSENGTTGRASGVVRPIPRLPLHFSVHISGDARTSARGLTQITQMLFATAVMRFGKEVSKGTTEISRLNNWGKKGTRSLKGGRGASAKKGMSVRKR